MKQTFIATAVDKDAAKVEAFRGQAVCFGLPFDVETGTRVSITFETIDQTTGGMDDAEPGPGTWAKRLEKMKAEQAEAPKPKPKRPQTSYFYIGRKSEKPTVVVEGVRPCRLVRALQSIVGIHWSKGGGK